MTQTDTSGNTGTSNANTFTVDTTAADRGVSITGENKAGGTAGKIEAGDTLTYTYSEAMSRRRRCGAAGTARAPRVHIKFASSGNDTITVLTTADATSIKLGSVATNGDYVSATTTFNATMALSADGASVVVTLGTPSNVTACAPTRAAT